MRPPRPAISIRALLIVLAAMTWGTTGATMKLVAAGSPMSPLAVGFLRVAIAAPCLCLAAVWLGGGIRMPSRGGGWSGEGR